MQKTSVGSVVITCKPAFIPRSCSGQYGVHFIAVANNIDSDEQESSEFAPFLNIHERVVSARPVQKGGARPTGVKGKAGKPTSNSAIYGYKKDPEDKDHWLVDEEAAAVVRRIFRLAVEGHGPYEIFQNAYRREGRVSRLLSRQAAGKEEKAG